MDPPETIYMRDRLKPTPCPSDVLFSLLATGESQTSGKRLNRDLTVKIWDGPKLDEIAGVALDEKAKSA
jgi:hypothetical protein